MSDAPDAPAERDATPVVYLAGLGRSGSTLVERTFARLDGAVAVGELTHLWRRGLVENERCGCGAPFRDCEFWTAVGERAYGGWANLDPQAMASLSEQVDRTRYVPLLLAARAPARTRSEPETAPALDSYLERTREFASVLAPLYAAIASVSGEQVVVDSSKDPSYAYVLRLVDDVRLEVVHTIRDAPAVAYSWAKFVDRPDAEQSQMSRWAPRRTAVLWSGQNMVVRGLRARGVPVSLVRYEDFVADPAGQFATLLERIGLGPVDPASPLMEGLADGFVEMGVDHTVSGNPIRFRTGRMEIRADRAWEQGLTASDRRMVEAITAPVRWRFGYLGGRRPAPTD